MKNKNLITILIAIVTLVFLLSTGITVASWKSEGATVNTITTGLVKGQIVEEYEDGQVVSPGSEVTKVVQVKNTGDIDVVVRVKVSKAWGAERDVNGKLIVDNTFSTDNILIDFNDKEWEYREDGYFYYIGFLKPEEITPPLLEEFRIDGENTDNKYGGMLADILIHMEIVQVEGHGISFWDMTLADLGIVYKEGEKTNITTTVNFKNPEEGFEFKVNGGDLFANFKNMVPGETRSQVISVTNSYMKEKVEIFLRADIAEQTQDIELVQKLLREYTTLVVTDSKGNVIYRGPAWGNLDVDSNGNISMKNEKSLGIFASGETKNLNVSLIIDPAIGTDYEDLLANVKWIFTAEGVDDGKKVTPTPKVKKTTPTPYSGGKDGGDDHIYNPKDWSASTDANPYTGDMNVLWRYISLACGAALILLVLLYRKNEEEQKI